MNSLNLPTPTGHNESIKCSVGNCAYHNDDYDCCSLTSVRIGTHEANPTKKECVDCISFELKQF